MYMIVGKCLLGGRNHSGLFRSKVVFIHIYSFVKQMKEYLHCIVEWISSIHHLQNHQQNCSHYQRINISRCVRIVCVDLSVHTGLPHLQKHHQNSSHQQRHKIGSCWSSICVGLNVYTGLSLMNPIYTRVYSVPELVVRQLYSLVPMGRHIEHTLIA